MLLKEKHVSKFLVSLNISNAIRHSGYNNISMPNGLPGWYQLIIAILLS